MTYKEALEYCLDHIWQRIDEMGELATKNRENDDLHAAARNFQNGLIECRDLIEKIGTLAKWGEEKSATTDPNKTQPQDDDDLDDVTLGPACDMTDPDCESCQ